MTSDSRGSAEHAARDIAAKLQQAGHQAYFAGGCVRDQLLGRQAEDFDIATSADPSQVQKVFPRARGVGEFFGVMLVYKNGWPVQVATFRKEGPYTDHRRPDSVSSATVEEDSARRDFTINGMYWDPVAERLIDFHEGKQDLEKGVVRAIGRPVDRLEEDHLRMLRAVRFASRFGFDIEDATAEAIRDHSTGLAGISQERIGEEIRRMLLNGNRALAAAFLESLGLSESVLGEKTSCENGTRHLVSIQGELSRSDYPVAVAAWAKDMGLESSPELLASRWRLQLKLSNADRDGLQAILEIIERLRAQWKKMGVAAQKRVASLHWFEAARCLLSVDCPEMASRISEDVQVLSSTGLAPARLLSGSALLESGMPPGPRFGEIIEAVYDAQLEGRIHSLEEALTLAKDISQKSESHD